MGNFCGRFGNRVGKRKNTLPCACALAMILIFAHIALGAQYYQDSDQDGYGDPDFFISTSGDPPAGYVSLSGDCDDANPFVHPGASEICGDGIDQDCSNGDLLCSVDQDGDGWRTEVGDCNDTRADIHPRAAEVCGDGVDQNCDGEDLPCMHKNCVSLSDHPLETQYQVAPANIMLVLDNSGSMDFSFLTSETDGAYRDYYYLYDLNDQIYSWSYVIPDSHKGYWKTRWSGYNRLYYNPAITYSPWPATAKYPDLKAFKDDDHAQPHLVKTHPILGNHTADLNQDYATAANAGMDIPYAHYFVRSGNTVYLVTLTQGQIRYYQMNDSNDENTKTAGFTQVHGVDIPNVTQRSYLEERQNFANWFCFHRKRYLVAANALARLINQMDGIYMGIYTINAGSGAGDDSAVVQSVLPVRVHGNDSSQVLINQLYELDMAPLGTPLREGLKAVGQYFDQTDGIEISRLGPSPYATEAQGGACQQAFALLVTDGHWTDAPGLGIGNQDGDAWENTLADTAMYYYKRDLSPLPDKVRPNAVDPMTSQHLVTYGVAFGVRGSIDPDQYPNCPEACDSINPTCDQCPPNWPEPQGNDYSKIDDLYHAALNGRGELWRADDPTSLALALKRLLQDIQSRKGTAASLAVNVSEIADSTTVYKTSYDPESWSGDLKAFSLDPTTGIVAADPTWSAARELEAQLKIPGFWRNQRKIITNDGNTGLAFNLSAAQTLGVNTDVMDYIRGDQSLEGKSAGQFRVRKFRLGDMIHSEPALADGLIWVGANDGMLHAFEQNSGKERLAYIPGLLLPHLAQLSSQSYSHRYFVDATPYVSRLDGGKTYLVSGLGKGGKGIFCLDISKSKLNPATEEDAVSLFKWAYPLTDDPDMGYSFAKPYIVNSKAGYVAIFGNGYDSANARACLYVLDAEDGSLIKKIDTGVGNATTACNGLSTPALIDPDRDGLVDYVYAGDLLGNLWKFDLTAPETDQWGVAFMDGSATPQSLFQALNKSGQTQPITHKPDVVPHCNRARDGYLVCFGTGRYLGSDDSTDSTVQTIYGIWDWAMEWVESGRNKKERNPKDKYLGRFETNGSGERSLSHIKTLSYLKPGARGVALVEQSQIHADDDGVRVLTRNQPNWYHRKSDKKNSKIQFHVGWYFDLPVSRERVTKDFMVRNNTAVVISSVPSPEVCETGGYSFLMELNACTGGRTNSPRFDYTQDNCVDERDTVLVDCPENPGNRIRVAPSGIRMDSLVNYPVIVNLERNIRERKYISTSDGKVTIMDEAPEKTGVYSWKELKW